MIIYKQEQVSKSIDVYVRKDNLKRQSDGFLLKYRAQWQRDTTSTIAQTSRAIY